MSNLYKMYIGMNYEGITFYSLKKRLRRILKNLKQWEYFKNDLPNKDEVFFELLYLKFDCELALLVFKWIEGRETNGPN